MEEVGLAQVGWGLLLKVGPAYSRRPKEVRKSLPCREGEFTNEIDPNKIRYL